ncbi:DUF29 domain-containing protein [Floridanema evergladense]|uniref:DUF29 domain-containing protein n=1 Tax=Floridaenema evergladense BLCC-F167 TaxID=3153639 RepID=A0ABV4WR07_9CYAN
MNLPLIDLYETDFYGWTQKQVELLRQNQLDLLDIKNLIEEIESLGKQQQQELVSRLEILLGHLLKWQYQPNKRSSSWLKTIREQRRKIKDIIEKNPSLKPFFNEATNKAYLLGLDLAVDETGLQIKTFPSEVPYSWELINSPEFFPGEITDKDRDLFERYGISPKSTDEISES